MALQLLDFSINRKIFYYPTDLSLLQVKNIIFSPNSTSNTSPSCDSIRMITS